MLRTNQVYHISGYSVGNSSYDPVSVTAAYNTVHLFPEGETLRSYTERNKDGKANEPFMLSSANMFRPNVIAMKHSVGLLIVPYDSASVFREELRLYAPKSICFYEHADHGVVTCLLDQHGVAKYATGAVKVMDFWDGAIYDDQEHMLKCLTTLTARG